MKERRFVTKPTRGNWLAGYLPSFDLEVSLCLTDPELARGLIKTDSLAVFSQWISDCVCTLVKMVLGDDDAASISPEYYEAFHTAFLHFMDLAFLNIEKLDGDVSKITSARAMLKMIEGESERPKVFFTVQVPDGFLPEDGFAEPAEEARITPVEKPSYEGAWS